MGQVQAPEKAQLIFRFLKHEEHISDLSAKIIASCKRVRYIQKNFLQKFKLNAVKLEILKKRWLKLLMDLLQKAKKIKDKEMINQVNQLLTIPKNVQETVLTYYLRKAQGLYRIAFSQYRLLHCGDITSSSRLQLKEMLALYIKEQNEDILKEKEYAIPYGSIESHKIHQYKKILNIGEYKQYLINSFNQIGIREPFPLELSKKQLKHKVKKKREDMVYKANRYVDGAGGLSCVYVPCGELLFKIIRAC